MPKTKSKRGGNFVTNIHVPVMTNNGRQTFVITCITPNQQYAFGYIEEEKPVYNILDNSRNNTYYVELDRFQGAYKVGAAGDKIKNCVSNPILNGLNKLPPEVTLDVNNTVVKQIFEGQKLINDKQQISKCLTNELNLEETVGPLLTNWKKNTKNPIVVGNHFSLSTIKPLNAFEVYSYDSKAKLTDQTSNAHDEFIIAFLTKTEVFPNINSIIIRCFISNEEIKQIKDIAEQNNLILRKLREHCASIRLHMFDYIKTNINSNIASLYLYRVSSESSGGASFKKTPEKVMLGKLQRVVYKGARGVKYVKMRGTFVKLSDAKKSMQKKK